MNQPDVPRSRPMNRRRLPRAISVVATLAMLATLTPLATATLAAAPAAAQSTEMVPAAPAACGSPSAGKGSAFASVTTTTSSISWQIGTNLPIESGTRNDVELCRLNGDGTGEKVKITATGGVEEPHVRSGTVRRFGIGSSAPRLNSGTDYWIRWGGYATGLNFAWQYAGTKASPAPAGCGLSGNSERFTDVFSPITPADTSVDLKIGPGQRFTVTPGTTLRMCSQGSDSTWSASVPSILHGETVVTNLNGSWSTLANSEATLTVSGLTAETEYWFRLQWGYGTDETEWHPIRTTPTPTAVPQFAAGEATTLRIAENNADGASVGTLSAVQSDTDPLTYSLAGTDAASFSLDASTGELKVAPGLRLDYETKSSYSVTVQVTDGKDGAGMAEATPTIDDTIAVTVEVTDTVEPPAALSVVATSPVSLRVSWEAPTGLDAGTTVSDYDVRWYQGDADPTDEADWTEEDETGAWPDPGTGTSVEVTGLSPATAYRVQVRADVGGESPWSASGSAVTQAALAGAGVLLSNIGQPESNVIHGNLADLDFAQAFRTGSSIDGYTVGTVEVDFADVPAGVRVQLVRFLNDPAATEVVATLANPASLARGDNTFTAPAGTVLEADARYWVLVGGTSGNLSVKTTNNEDTGGKAGWSLQGGRHSKTAPDAAPVQLSGGLPLGIRINGAPAPPPVLVSNLGQADHATHVADLAVDKRFLQFFTTGANAGGYALRSVEVDFATLPAGVSVKLTQGIDLGSTGETVAVLANPASLAAGVNVFTVPAGTVLGAATRYQVVVEGTSGRLSLKASTDDDPDGAPGWGIGSDRWSVADEGQLFERWIGVPIGIRVNGAAAPAAPAAPTVVATSPVSLRVSWAAPGGDVAADGYDLRWYQGDADPADEAHWIEPGEAGAWPDPGDATSLEVVGLSAGTTYRVQVRAKTGPAAGAWSASGSATTQAALAGAEVLVSNIGQADSPHIHGNLANFGFAQAFTTGTNPDGYAVGTVEVDFADVPTGVSVALVGDSGNNLALHPGTAEVAALAGPASLAAGDNVFTAPAGTVLAASTRYWVVVRGTSGNLSLKTSGDEDAGGKAGWSVRDVGTGLDKSTGLLATTLAFPLGTRVNGVERDLTPPTVASAVMEDITDTGGLYKSFLRITFSESLNPQEPSINDFAVKVDGQPFAVATNRIKSAEGEFTLLFLTVPSPDAVVTVSYTKPDDVEFQLQDVQGNAVESFADLAVTNLLPPAVTGVQITSDPGEGDVYGVGEPVEVSLTFNTSVDVDTASGTPRLKIGLASGTEKWAGYHSGTGTKVLVFRYTPVAGDSSAGVSVTEDTLELNGGTIESASSQADAALGHDGLESDSGHKIDTTAPTRSAVVLNDAALDVMIVVFDEALDANSVPAAGQFTARVDGNLTTVEAVSVPSGGNRVEITLSNPHRVGGASAQLSYSYDSTDASHRPIQDLAGNDAAAFSNRTPSLVSAPSFTAGASTTLSIAENNADAASVGTVAATDADGDTALVYWLAPAGDASSFTIDPSTGAIKVASGVTLDHEAKSSYTLSARVTDGEDAFGLPLAAAATMVSSIGQRVHGSPSIGGGSGALARSQVFTTGDHPSGYTLSDVKAQVGNWGAAATVIATIWSTDASGSPDAQLYPLTNPATRTAHAANSFTAPAGAKLEPNTAYAFVLHHTSAALFQIDSTDSGAEDGGAASGWSIADVHHVLGGTGDWSEYPTTSLRISVDASQYQPPDDTIAVTVEVTNVNEPPAAPTALMVTGQTSRTVALQWTAPPAGTGPAPNGYDVRWFNGTADPTDPADWTEPGEDGGHRSAGTATTTTLAGLEPDTDYRIQVRADSADGAGPWTASVDATTTNEPDIRLTASQTSINEGSAATFTVTASRLLAENAEEVTVQLVVQTGSTATSGTDYTALTSLPTITIPANDPDDMATVTITTTQDTTYEGPETIKLGGTASGFGVIPAEITIVDDDLPAITISGGSAVTEGTAAVFTVTAGTAPLADLTVNLTVSEASGSDFVATTDEGSKTVTITAGSTSVTYSVTTQGDSAHEPNGSVTVTVASGTGYTVGSTSSASVTVNDDDNADPTGAVTISGTVTQGQTLTAATGAVGDPDGLATFSYQWKRDGTDISGATSSTYVLVQADVGSAITVTVSWTDGGGTAESLTSAATAAVANVNDSPTGAVTISGTVTQGQTLTANTGAVGDPDGLATFSYQWKRDGTDISGATSSTYVLVQADVGSAITVTVSWTDGGGTAESLTSAATAAVANVNDSPTVANPIPNRRANVGTAFSYAFAANTFADADGDPLTYTATKADDAALPSWLTFTALTRTFSGTPQAADAGTVSVKVTASDGTASVSDTFDITVTDVAIISDVEVVSVPRSTTTVSGKSHSAYGSGQNIVVAVTWDRDVSWDVSADDAEIRVILTFGVSTNRAATLVTDGETTGTARTLWFSYTVVSADSDANGVAVSASSGGKLVRLRNGATLKDDEGRNAGLDHIGLKSVDGHRVNGSNAASTNSAPTFDDGKPATIGNDLGSRNAPSGIKVAVSALASFFRDSDGDPLRLTWSIARPDALISSRLAMDNWFAQPHYDCPLEDLSPALTRNDDDMFENVVTFKATDPDGASVNATLTLITGWSCQELSRATVQGTTLTLTFNRDLPSAPGSQEWRGRLDSSQFTVKVDGTEVALASANPLSVSGAEITLELATAVTPENTVTVSYAPEGPDRVRSFTDETVADLTPAVPESASVSGRDLTLTFNRDLMALDAAAGRNIRYAFGVTGLYWNGVPLAGVTPEQVSTSGKTVTLVLTSSLSLGRVVTVNYDPAVAQDIGTEFLDSGGNKVPAFSGLTMTNASPPTAPLLLSGQVEGTALTLDFDADLDSSSAPAGSRFLVTMFPSEYYEPSRLISGTGTATVNGKQVMVTLASPVDERASASVWYRPDRAGSEATPLRADSAGPEVAEIFGSLIRVHDRGSPTLVDSVVAGTSLTLYYGEKLDRDSTPAKSAFAVRVAGASRGVSSVSMSDDAVTLTLDSSVTAGQAVTVAYTVPSTDPIQDLAGNDAAALSAESVTNEGPTDPGKPALAATDPAVADSSAVTLTFTRPLDPASVPSVSAFSLSQSWLRVDGIAVRGAKVVLSVNPGLYACIDDITISYTKPATNALRNVWGTEADAFSGQSVTNQRADQCVSMQPTGQTGEASGNSGTNGLRSVRLQFERPLNSLRAPNPDGFSMASTTPGSAGAPPIDIEDIEYSPDATQLKLALSRALTPGERLTVSYRQPRAGAGLWDSDGNHIAPFSAQVEVPADEPTVTGVEVISDAGDDNTYALGEIISVRVTFSEAVEVVGTPTLGIDMDPAPWGRKDAAYSSGSGTADLVFAHEVVEPNYSTQGVAVLADTLALAGGTIRSASSQTDADLDHAGLAHDPAHKVDWRQLPPDANGNRTPVFRGTAARPGNAPPGFLVGLPLDQSDFWDPDGDPLTFTLSASRDDVYVPGGLSYSERIGRVFFQAKTACALADLSPSPGDLYETVVTMTAADPDGATAHATVTFRTNPTQHGCPSLASAAVDGATLTLTLDGVVAPSYEPPTVDEFVVKADGTAVSLAGINRVSRRDTTITLTLASPVSAGQTVTVSYVPSDNPIAAEFADQAVSNDTAVPAEPEVSESDPAQEGDPIVDESAVPGDGTVPISAAVSGKELTLTFNRDLGPIDSAAAGALRYAIVVKGGAFYLGDPVANQSPSRVVVDGATVTLTLGTAVLPDHEILVIYVAAAAGSALKDSDGTPVADFAATLTTTQRN